MATVQQILEQEFECSSLSGEVSFTVSDILKEPLDDQMIVNVQIDQDMMDDLFEDDQMLFQDHEQQQQPDQKKSQNQSDVEDIDNDKGVTMQNVDNPDVKGSIPQKQDNSKQRMSQNLYKSSLLPLKPSNSNQVKEKSIIRSNYTKGKSNEKSSIFQSQKSLVVRRYARIQDMNVTPIEDIQNMTYVALKNVTALFNQQSKRQVGLPTCISTTGDKFLAIGTSNSTIAVFEVGIKGYKILKSIDGKNYGSVISVSISRDNKYLVAGHESGLITVWDLYSNTLSKIEVMGKSKVIKVLFCCQDSSYFIANDCDGNVIMYTLQKMFWLNIKQQRLIDKTQHVYYDIKYTTLISGRQILALCCLDFVLILTTRPTLGVMHRIFRPQGVNKMKIPNTELGRCMIKQQEKDILCVSWGKDIIIYIFKPVAYQYQDIELLHSFPHETTLHNLQFITSQILITLDQHQTFRAINITELLSNGRAIINTTELLEEVVYQRQIKEKRQKFIKSFANTMSNCSYSKNQKEIFFICKDSVFRARIHKWPQYVHSLLKEQRQWFKGLKICLQLYAGNLNIFAQKLKFNKKTKSIFCEIGSIFLEKQLKQILTGNVILGIVRQQIEVVFDIVIQFFVKMNSFDYLFIDILNLIHKKCPTDDFEEFFVDCLQPFIMEPQNSLIKSIPDRKAFRFVILHFMGLNKISVIDKLIMGLQNQSIFYEEIVQVCTQNKLFKSLAHVCSIHQDFISPANKILEAWRRAKQQNKVNGASQNQAMFRYYLRSILQGRYITGKQIPINFFQLLMRELEIWLPCQETYNFLISQNPEQYFKNLKSLINGLRMTDQDQYIHNTLRKIMNYPNSMENKMRITKLIMQASIDVEIWDQCLEFTLNNHPNLRSIDYKGFIDLLTYLKFINKFQNKLKNQFKDLFMKVITEQKLELQQIYYVCICLKFPIPENIYVKTDQNSRFQFISKFSFPKILAEYILDTIQAKIIDANMSDLLKMSSEATMAYVIASYNSIQVNQKIRQISKSQQKYVAIRKIMKMIRKKKRILQIQSKKQILIVASSQIKQINMAVSIDKDLIQFYLECLCQLKRQRRVYSELKANPNDYSTFNCMKIVEKFNYTSCIAFLKKLQKKYEDSYNLYEIVYNKYFDQNYRKIIQFHHCDGSFMGRIFYQMLSVIKSQENPNWLKLLKSVLVPLEQRTRGQLIANKIQHIYEVNAKNPHPFILKLLQIIEVTLTELSRHTTVESMTKQLSSHTSLLSKTFIINSLSSTLNSFSRNILIYNLSNQMVVSDQVKHFQDLYQNYRVKGYTSVGNFCQKCCKEGVLLQSEVQQNEDSNFKLLKVYPCGHLYHEKPCDSGRCIQCAKKQLGQQTFIKQKIETERSGAFIKKEGSEIENEDVYRALAFDDYINSQFQEFEHFRNKYESYIIKQL